MSGAKISEARALTQALSAVAVARRRSVDPELHGPEEDLDHRALARMAITTEVDDATAANAAAGRLGAHGYGGSGIFGAGSRLDALHQALAAVHLDLTSALVRVELDLSRDSARRDSTRRARLRRNASGGAPAPQALASGDAIGTRVPPPGSHGASVVHHEVMAHNPHLATHPTCAHAEARLLAEVRKHAAARAVAKVLIFQLRPRRLRRLMRPL